MLGHFSVQFNNIWAKDFMRDHEPEWSVNSEDRQLSVETQSTDRTASTDVTKGSSGGPTILIKIMVLWR